ncbi:hypothetical protein AVEN_169111-1 [Araneus ventricosus]|uniref:Uncharacterized protein n=1 Tax=Araneus ventricosus TaxID=182803 RepID=A0A4Y2MY43_ARAVE|nr:hypothetical protein AVEN_169111-1 [Araneus ventricosus]
MKKRIPPPQGNVSKQTERTRNVSPWGSGSDYQRKHHFTLHCSSSSSSASCKIIRESREDVQAVADVVRLGKACRDSVFFWRGQKGVSTLKFIGSCAKCMMKMQIASSHATCSRTYVSMLTLFKAMDVDVKALTQQWLMDFGWEFFAEAEENKSLSKVGYYVEKLIWYGKFLHTQLP